MKTLIASLFTIFLFSGCQQQGGMNHHVSLLNEPQKQNNNYNASVGYRIEDKQKERQARLELSKLEAQTKLEIAKIQSQSQVKIAEVDAQAKKEVAHTDSKTKIETSKIAALTKKEDTMVTIYTTVAIAVVILAAMLLLYFNNKKERDLKNKMLHDQLQHEAMLREREHNERRLMKMLELVGEGKLSHAMEEQVILSLTKPSNGAIDVEQITHEPSQQPQEEEPSQENEVPTEEVTQTQEETTENKQEIIEEDQSQNSKGK